MSFDWIAKSRDELGKGFGDCVLICDIELVVRKLTLVFRRSTLDIGC